MLGIGSTALLLKSMPWTACIPAVLAIALIAAAALRGRETYRALPPVGKVATQLRFLHWSVVIIGAIVVFVSGLATVYFAKATFGWSNYLDLIAWGFGFGSAVTLTKSLIPKVTLG